jgi:hypothetical protein
MEGSMKMMSWSRYHCLPKLSLRAERRYGAARILGTRLRIRGHRRSPAGWAPTRYFQFVIRLFRT